ncbi:rod shape-determining protein RodA [Candidatus Uhrbacteria bacterium CG10_big_fil_rev_8_21_14_0_10_50_16]|uniref:Rod shape-determining protein RodA n=1 Tax=Candidatus Uhrbacteria bacterium CG10_big_fil_rev_8_21_14_0_10_50_16 TaxID=1975039 RepID=A0A2H0RPE2_9BACT|nr:MAG: rod shape-determining protein RodA [Candidatus Uhrbacteria bacterium CG10_big_fil_rev_8_21_14_0_10_50_16]
MNKYTRLLAQFDWVLAVAVFVLLVLGFSALYGIGLASAPPDFTNVTKQLIALGIGLMVGVMLMLWNYKQLRSYAGTLFAIGTGLLLSVVLFGVTRRGTTGWFDLGIVDVQPVEFAKIILVIAVAAIFARRSRRYMGWRELIATGIPVTIYVGLVMLQPDFGSAALMIGVWGIMVLFAGLNKKIIAVLAGGGLLAGIAAWLVVFQEFQKNRILTFLNPDLDPLGQGYNVTQAKIAIGAGRMFGRGLGLGSQSQLKFLPEAQTDFIFAAIAEELGFVGIVLILSAFAVLFWRLWILIRNTRDEFSAFLIVGLGALLFLQMLVNVAMNLGLMPVTGLPLPFVSYGGTSLMASLIILGLIASVVIRTPINRNLTS